MITKDSFVQLLINVDDFSASYQGFARTVQNNDEAMQISAIAKKNACPEEEVVELAKHLWKKGYIEVVKMNLAIGLIYEGDYSWSFFTTKTKPQDLANALMEVNGIMPFHVVLVSADDNVPKVIGTYKLHKNYV